MDINKSFEIKDSFENWYLKNKNRFKYKLIKESENDLGIVYSFKNITKNIKLAILKSYCELELQIYNNNELVDLIPIEYIGSESYDEIKGYYDSDRIDSVYKYYKTRRELYINEVFEKLIYFINQEFVIGNYLLMIEDDGFSYAKIKSRKDLLVDKKLLKKKLITMNINIVNIVL